MDRMTCLAIGTFASNLIAYASFMVATKARKRARALALIVSRSEVDRRIKPAFRKVNDLDLRVCLLEGFEQKRYATRNVNIAKTAAEPNLDAA